MTELYRRVVVVVFTDVEGDKEAVTLQYEYKRDKQAEKDAELGAAVRSSAIWRSGADMRACLDDSDWMAYEQEMKSMLHAFYRALDGEVKP